MDEVMTFLEPLLLTIVIEAAAARMLGMKEKKDLFLTVLVNCITNPVLVLLSLILMYNIGTGPGRAVTYLILEPLVVYAEYRLYQTYLDSGFSPLRLSVILNLISFSGGLLWNCVF